jgi:hypothetical protein
MIRRISWPSVTLLAVLLPGIGVSQEGGPARRRIGQVVVSDSLPRIRVEVDTAFEYFGQVTLPVGEVAIAEQFIFAEVRNGRIERAVIVHFEHFFPDNARHFGYPPGPAATLGEHTYLHQNWWLGADYMAKPAVDSLIRGHGLTTDTVYGSDRYVRVLPESDKHEFILFYLESGTLLGNVGRVAPSVAGDIPPEAAQALAQRARRAFRVVSTP